MRLLLALPLALLLLPMPVAAEADTVGCGPTLAATTASNAQHVPSETLAYGPEAAAGAFVAREDAAVRAWAECEDGVIYCTVEPNRPECEFCHYVSTGLAQVNCCDYPPKELPGVTPSAYCAPYETTQGGCTSDGEVALGQIEIVTAAGTFYVDDRNYATGNGIWVYVEANGLDHLQRGGASFVVPDDAEVCSDGFELADALVL